MLEPIVGFFDKLIDQFTWRRLVFLAALLAACTAGIWSFETYTQSYKLARLERQVSLLEKLAVVSSQAEIKADPDLQAVAISLKKQLRDTDVTIPARFELLPWARKALATAAAWFVFGLFIALIPNTYTRTRPETASVFAGMTVVASPFVAMSIALPTDPWLNYAIYPIGHLFLLGLFLLWVGRLMARKYGGRSDQAAS
nr:hypothetical protein [uncultured Albidiferax sp.]